MNLREHIKADLLFLGYTDPSIHRMIDSLDVLKQYGPRHRIFGHNFDTINMINAIGGKKARNIALLHILIDFDIPMDRRKLRNKLRIERGGI